MKTPHKHAEVIKAWADGAEIQTRWNDDEPWRNCTVPRLYEEAMYRVKPEPKPDVINFATVEIGLGNVYIYTRATDKGNLKLTFDGETGQLKSAEVL